MGENEAETTSSGPPRNWLVKGIVLLVVLAVLGIVVFRYGDSLKLENLARQEASFRQFQQDHPVLVYGIAFLIYVLVTALALPFAVGMTLVIGWFFGFRSGLILVSFASTSGATLAFLLSRYLLRDTIQNRFGDRLAGFNRALEREGAFYLFTLRLIPAVPFFVINLVMGLTPIRTWTFWWVSQLGMVAGTCVYVVAGSTLPDLQTLVDQGAGGILTPKMVVAFILLGLFPIAAKKLLERIRPAKQPEVSKTLV